jgi:gamma-glutamyltranspeptidase
LQMLNILETFDLEKAGFNSADYLHLQVEAKKLAFAECAIRDRTQGCRVAFAAESLVPNVAVAPSFMPTRSTAAPRPSSSNG